METVAASDPDAVRRASSALDAGALAVVPTDTQYALSADALDEDAVLRVFAAKRRGADMALPVCIAGIEDLHHVAYATPLARVLAERFWPGGLTLVLKARPWLPDALTGGSGTVAVRVPAAEFALALARAFGPYTVTSANRHGEPAALDVATARAALGDDVAVYVDGGRLPGVPSTMVDATGEDAKVLRAGAVRAEEVVAVGSAGRREVPEGRPHRG